MANESVEMKKGGSLQTSGANLGSSLKKLPSSIKKSLSSSSNMDENGQDEFSSTTPRALGDSPDKYDADGQIEPTKSSSVALYLVAFLLFPIRCFRSVFNIAVRLSQTLTNPERNFALFWNSVMMFVSLYNFAGLTFRCSYLYPLHLDWYSHPDWISAFALLDFVCDFIFLFDVLIGFTKPYTGEDGLLVFDLKKTTKHYLSIRKGWFWIDIFTAVPSDWVVLIGWPYLVPFFRLNRAVRLPLKFLHYFSYFENYLNVSASLIRIFKFVLVVLLVTHLVACFWYIVSFSEEPQNTIMWTNIENMPYRPIWSIYLYAFHWCFVTMVGYGGTIPASLTQLIYSEFVVCVGVALFVTVIGTVGSLITNLDSNASKNRQRLDEIKEYMKYRKIPYYLSNKIINYYTFLFKSRKGWDEEKILNDLPQYLRMEVALDMNRRIVEKVELFKNSSRMFISSVVLSLMPRMVLPGTNIVRRGDIGREMYFIASGVVHILSPKDDKTVIVKLREGSFFGEIAIIYDSLRSCTVRAGTYCDLYVLTKEAFERIERDYPDQVKRIRELAEKRKEHQAKQRQKEEEENQKEEALRKAQHEKDVDEQMQNLEEVDDGDSDSSESDIEEAG